MTGEPTWWPSRGLPVRGLDTGLGQQGYCRRCGHVVPDGPDICLGWLDGVAAACCGHGADEHAYVVIGAEPDADLADRTDFIVRRGAEALAYFAEQGVGPSR